MAVLFEKLVERPWLGAWLALGLVAAFAPGIPRISLSTNPRLSLDPESPGVAYYENFRANFPDEVLITIVLEAPDVFEIGSLASLRRLSLETQDIVGIAYIESFATAQPYSRENFTLAYRPYLGILPKTEEDIATLKRQAFASPFVRDYLINEAGTAAAIHLIADARAPTAPDEKRLVEAVEKILADEEAKLAGRAELYFIGPACLRVEESRFILRDALTLTPIAIGIVLFILLAFFRSFAAVLLPFVTGLLSIAATLGFMGLMGYRVTPLSCTIPTLLMVIGCTEDIHLVSAYAAGIRRGLGKPGALRRMAQVCAIPVLLTSLTTMIGFCALAISGIAFLREFALATTFGIAVNFLVTIGLTSLILRLLPVSTSFQSPEPFARLLRWFQHLFLHRRVAVSIVIVVVTGIVSAGALRIDVNTDPLAFFDPEAEIRDRFDRATERFPGFGSLVVSIETNRSRGVQELETFQKISRFSEDLTGIHGTVQSYPEILRHLHREFGEGSELSASAIRSYTAILPEGVKRRFLDHNASRTVIYVPAGDSDSRRVNQLTESIEAAADEILGPEFDVQVTGQLALVSQEARALAGKLGRDLAVLAGAVLVLMAILFRSIGLALVAMIPNTIPLGITFGMMGWLGIPLSFGTYPTALIVLCVAVNDTIHFFARYARDRKASLSNRKVIVEVIAREFRPVVCSSVAISAGFLVFVLAEFVTIRQGGLLTAIALGAALMADLLVSPILLAARDRDR